MIVFDLSCENGHSFEGWFSSSNDYAEQCERGLLNCPECGSENIAKSPMAPAVSAKGNQAQPSPDSMTPMSNAPFPVEVQKAMQALVKAQAKALKDSKWVGDQFAEKSRAMHYGEQELEAIHGKATLAEAKELLEEGVEISPLPFPVAEADKLN